MTLLVGFMLVITLVMWCAPDSPAGRLLRQQLVERPLRQFAKLERHRLIYVVLLAAMMPVAGEMIVLLGPETLATYAVYVDAVMVTYALAAVAQARAGFGRIRVILGKALRRPQVTRRKRSNRPTAARSKSASNDDDPAPALMVA